MAKKDTDTGSLTPETKVPEQSVVLDKAAYDALMARIKKLEEPAEAASPLAPNRGAPSAAQEISASKVPLYLHKVPGQEDATYVALNGKTYMIPRGKRVMVPRAIYEVIRRSDDARLITEALTSKLEAQYPAAHIDL